MALSAEEKQDMLLDALCSLGNALFLFNWLDGKFASDVGPFYGSTEESYRATVKVLFPGLDPTYAEQAYMELHMDGFSRKKDVLKAYQDALARQKEYERDSRRYARRTAQRRSR